MRARGFWRKQEEQNRSQIERGEGEKKEKIGKRSTNGLIEACPRVAIAWTSSACIFPAAWPLLKFVSKLELRRGEMKFRSAEETRSRMTNFFLEKGEEKEEKRERERKKRNDYRFSSRCGN